MIVSSYNSGKLRFFGGFGIGTKPEILPALLHAVWQLQAAEPVVYPLGAHFREPLGMVLVKAASGSSLNDQIPENVECVLLQSGIHMDLTEQPQILQAFVAGACGKRGRWDTIFRR